MASNLDLVTQRADLLLGPVRVRLVSGGTRAPETYGAQAIRKIIFVSAHTEPVLRDQALDLRRQIFAVVSGVVGQAQREQCAYIAALARQQGLHDFARSIEQPVYGQVEEEKNGHPSVP